MEAVEEMDGEGNELLLIAKAALQEVHLVHPDGYCEACSFGGCAADKDYIRAAIAKATGKQTTLVREG